MSSSSLSVDVRDRVALVVVQGDFDATGSATAVETFVAAVGGSPLDAVEIDMSGAGFVDSSGLGALIRLRQEARRRGARTTLVGLDHRLQKLLHLTGLADDFFTRPAASEPAAPARPDVG